MTIHGNLLMVDSSDSQSRGTQCRNLLAFYLDDFHTPIGVVINLLITGLILVSAGIFVAETYPLPAGIQAQLAIADSIILGLLVVEYGLRFWAAPDKLRFVFSLYSLLDLLAIVPFFVGFIDIRFVRIFRWFRILRLFRFLQPRTWFGIISTADGVIFARILFTLFAIIFVYSGLIFQVEHPTNPDTFRNFLDAFYFSAVTMTTVGFGDLTPISEAGRLLTVLMILTGVGLIPYQLGELIKHLVKTANHVAIACPTCHLSLHDEDAQFCKLCGTELYHRSARQETASQAR